MGNGRPRIGYFRTDRRPEHSHRVIPWETVIQVRTAFTLDPTARPINVAERFGLPQPKVVAIRDLRLYLMEFPDRRPRTMEQKRRIARAQVIAFVRAHPERVRALMAALGEIEDARDDRNAARTADRKKDQLGRFTSTRYSAAAGDPQPDHGVRGASPGSVPILRG